MKIEIYHANPHQFLPIVLAAVHSKSSHHMEHWDIVTDKGKYYLTQRDIKYYFKVLLRPNIIDDEKILFTFEYHEYSDPTHFVQCEYAGQFIECMLYNFGNEIEKIIIIPPKPSNIEISEN